jgi:hypothetical protein
VLAASAAIRLGGDALGAALIHLRGMHRLAASLAAAVVFVLWFLSLRSDRARRPALLALALALVLSVVGWATGTTPPPLAALFNQLGGIALAAVLAWMLGASAAQPLRERGLAPVALAFCGVQAAFGGSLAVLVARPGLGLLVAHAVLGLAAAALVAALGGRYVLWAALAPLLGAAAAVTPAFAAQAAHAFAAALLVCAAAHACARARSA